MNGNGRATLSVFLFAIYMLSEHIFTDHVHAGLCESYHSTPIRDGNTTQSFQEEKMGQKENERQQISTYTNCKVEIMEDFIEPYGSDALNPNRHISSTSALTLYSVLC